MEKKVLHINTGRGPAECAWVAAQVLKEILKEARGAKIKAEVIHRIEGDMNKTILSASVLLEGQNLSALMNAWIGSILWIGKSPYRKFHKRKNWFVEVSAKDLNAKEALKYEEVKFTATKSSGPGGQHTNKTSSAVRATHQPTGLSVLVQDSRSQHQNRKIAFTRLQELFSSHRRKELEQNEMNDWKEGITIQRGDAIRTFEGINFKPRK